MDCSTPGLSVHHQFPEFTQTHFHWVSDAIQLSHPVSHFSSHLQSFPASGSSPMSQFFASGGQSIGVSASASVLSMNIQDCFPLGWTGWIQIANGKLLYSIGGSAWCSGTTYRGREGDSRGRGRVYTYGWFMLMYDKPSQHCKAIIPQLKINKI